MYESYKVEELEKIKAGNRSNSIIKQGRFSKQSNCLMSLILQDDFVEFLTLPGYENYNTV